MSSLDYLKAQVNAGNMLGIARPLANVFFLVGIVLAFFGGIPLWAIGAVLIILSYIIDASGG